MLRIGMAATIVGICFSAAVLMFGVPTCIAQQSATTTDAVDFYRGATAAANDQQSLAQPQEPSRGKLAIPQHPERVPPDPKKTLPKAAQPNRQRHSTQKSSATHRQGTSLPRPGQPSRNLEPPGSDEPTAEDSSEPSVTEEVSPGLFPRLPHEFGSGITAEYIYTGGLFTNAFGGLENGQATRYRGNLDVVLNFDTAGMKLWDGGRFFLYSHNVHGSTLTANEVGDFQLYDNLDTSPRANDITQIAEYWYQQNFADDVWSIKLGKQDANANFAFTDFGGEFIHSSFGMVPTVPLPTYPRPTFGAATFFQPSKYFAVGGGVYDGVSADQASKLSRLGTSGALSLLQVQLTPQLGTDGKLPGSYRGGVFYHSGDWFDPAGGPNEFSGNHGFWATADQMLWLENPEEDDQQGFGVFAQYGWAPRERNSIQEYYGGGIIIRGLLPDRDEDVLGVGVANAQFSTLLRPAQTQETAIEGFYKIRVSPWIVLQPALVFIANPNGSLKDALIPGGRFEIVF